MSNKADMYWKKQEENMHNLQYWFMYIKHCHDYISQIQNKEIQDKCKIILDNEIGKQLNSVPIAHVVDTNSEENLRNLKMSQNIEVLKNCNLYDNDTNKNEIYKNESTIKSNKSLCCTTM
jgi:hypothetical protein